MSFRSDGDPLDDHAGRLFDPLHIVLGFRRQVPPVSDPGDIAFPAFHVFIYGLAVAQDRRERQFLELFSLIPVTDAYRDLLQRAEHVQLGQSNLRRGLHLYPVAGGHQVHRSDPVVQLCALAGGFAHLLSFLAKQFTDEMALADAGGIRLDHADDPIDLHARHPCADRSVGRQHIGGSGVGIYAEIQIPQRAHLRFKEDAFVVVLCFLQERARIRDKGFHRFAVFLHPGVDLLRGNGLRVVYAGEDQVLPYAQVLQVFPEDLRIEQFTGHDRLFLVFVGIERRNTQFGGTVLLVSQARFFQRVQFPVPGKQQGRAVADHQVLRRDRHAFVLDRADLLHQHFRIQRNAVADDVHNALAEHAGGQSMDLKFTVLVDYGMAGIGAALVTDHNVKSLGQQVDHAAFAFVTPVDPNDRGTSIHISSTFRTLSTAG